LPLWKQRLFQIDPVSSHSIRHHHTADLQQPRSL
jgi:hypothetical protein